MDPYYDPTTGLPFDPISGAPTWANPLRRRDSPMGSFGRGMLTGAQSVVQPRGAMAGDPELPPGPTPQMQLPPTNPQAPAPTGGYSWDGTTEQFTPPQMPSPRQYLGPGDGAPMFDAPPAAQPPQEPTPADSGRASQAALSEAMQPPQEQPPAASGVAPPLPTPPAFQPPPAQPQAALGAPQAAPPQVQPSDGALMAPTAQPQAPGDDYEAFATRLGGSESAGRFDAMNSGGYAGRVQFGAPRLQTLGMYSPGNGESMSGWGAGGGRDRAGGAWTGTFNIPGFPEVRTIEDFRRNPEAQRAAERAHFMDIDQAINNTPGAEAFNRDGLRAVANLGGNGGMRRFVESGGQANPADGNGTRLSDFYRRFAGSDAPPGAAGMQGGGANSAPGSLQSTWGTTDPSKPAAAEPSAAFLSGYPTAGASPSVMGIPSSALMAWGSGMLAGRTPMEGMANAGAAFTGQMNQEQTLAQSRENQAGLREDRRLARHDAQQTRNDTRDYRREQIRVAEARVAAGANQGANAQNVQSSVVVQDPQTGNAYRSTLLRDGTTTITTLNGGAVPEDVAGRLRQGNDPGQGAEARDMVTQRTAAFQEASAARQLRPALANARRVLQEDPNLTGTDWGTRGVNWIAETLGVPVGQRTPENIAMLRQALQQGNMQTLMQIAPSLRPMSNVDLQAIASMSPSMLSNPRMIGQWLDQMDRGAERAERMGDALAAQLADPAVAQSIMRSGGVSAWRQRYEADRTRNERGGDQPQPTVQPGTNAQGQREWQPAPRNAQERQVGQTYQTQRGPMIWRGQGWEPAQ